MKLPRKIGNYDMYYSNEIFNHLDTLNDVISYYNDIPRGSLDEIIVGYDNYNYRGILRVTGRGNNLRIECRYQLLLDDGYGSFSSEQLERKDVTCNQLSNSIEKFLFWFKKLAHENSNKTQFDRYIT